MSAFEVRQAEIFSSLGYTPEVQAAVKTTRYANPVGPRNLLPVKAVRNHATGQDENPIKSIFTEAERFGSHDMDFWNRVTAGGDAFRNWMIGDALANIPDPPFPKIAFDGSALFPRGSPIPGCTRTVEVTGARFWEGPSTQEIPTQQKFDEVAAFVDNAPYCYYDIEHWPVSHWHQTIPNLAERIAAWNRHDTVFNELTSRLPNTIITAFGGVSATSVANYPFSFKFQECLDDTIDQTNTLIGAPNTQAKVDHILTELYFREQNTLAELDRYILRLKALVGLNRIYGKPVRGFVWWRDVFAYEGGDTSDSSIVPLELWEAVLDAWVTFGDGFVIWIPPPERFNITREVQKRIDAVTNIASAL